MNRLQASGLASFASSPNADIAGLIYAVFGKLKRRLAVLTHPPLPVVDEIGYIPIQPDGAMLFFQVMSRRYTHASTVLTSNKSYEEWGETLGDDVMAATLINRGLHHYHVASIPGKTYRMHHHAELYKTLQRGRWTGILGKL